MTVLQIEVWRSEGWKKHSITIRFDRKNLEVTRVGVHRPTGDLNFILTHLEFETLKSKASVKLWISVRKLMVRK